MKREFKKMRGNRAAGRAVLLCCSIFCSLFYILSGPSASFAAYEDVGVGARGPGMGNAMVSAADDVYAVHYNAAGLGLLTNPQFTAAYTQFYKGLTDDSNLGTSFFGYAHPLNGGDEGTVAAGWNVFSLNSSLYRENTVYFSYGRLALTNPDIKGKLYLGTSLKYLYSSFGSFAEAGNATNGLIATGQSDPLLTENNRSKAFDADAGALYRFMKHYQLGLQLAHIPRPNVAFGSGYTDRLPLAVKVGFNYMSLISNLVAQYETKKAPTGAQDAIFTAAGERWFPTNFFGDLGVRGGLGLGTRDYKQVSMGLSYRSRRVQVDYGYALPLRTITDAGGIHRMSITFRFGKPGAEEETLEMLMQAMRGLSGHVPAEIVQTTVTVFVKPEPTANEGAVAEKLALAEEALKDEGYREAVKLCNAAIELDPRSAAAWQDLGIAYLGMERFKSSVSAWEKAYELEKSPALREAIKGYIKSISKMDRQHGAAPQKQQAVQAAPPAAQTQTSGLSRAEINALLDQGVDQYVNHDFEKARITFNKVLAADPGNVDALKALRRIIEEELK